MAKPTWLNLTPTSGTGNADISNSASAHTGRLERNATVTITADGVADPITYQVTQLPKDEFVAFDAATFEAPQTAGDVTITGTSNSASLTFSADAPVTVGTNYTAHGISTVNGQAIQDDPGASEEYDFSATVTLPENTTVQSVDYTIKVTDGAGVEHTFTVRQHAGEAFVSVAPQSITIPQDGSAVNVSVTSNVSWTVS